MVFFRPTMKGFRVFFFLASHPSEKKGDFVFLGNPRLRGCNPVEQQEGHLLLGKTPKYFFQERKTPSLVRAMTCLARESDGPCLPIFRIETSTVTKKSSLSPQL